MNAVIETGGKQYRVEEGLTVRVEKLGAEPGAEVDFDKVLAIVKEDGAVFGNPYVAGASVSAEVVANGKGAKVLVHKQRPRRVYRKLNGHRQSFTTVRIKEIRHGS